MIDKARAIPLHHTEKYLALKNKTEQKPQNRLSQGQGSETNTWHICYTQNFRVFCLIFFPLITLNFSSLLKATQTPATEPGLTFPVFWFQIQCCSQKPVLWPWALGWEDREWDLGAGGRVPRGLLNVWTMPGQGGEMMVQMTARARGCLQEDSGGGGLQQE